jgi:hypothetical protein
MTRPDPVDTNLRKLVFVLFLAVAIMEMASHQGLYADGANFLVGILEKKGFLLFDPHRQVHGLLTQIPVVLALKLGITNLRFYIALYAGLLIFWPMLFWGLALYHMRYDGMFWTFVMLFCLVYYNIGFFANGEADLCFSITACILACFLRAGDRTRRDRALLMVCAFLYPELYASTLFFGGLFFGMGFLMWRQEREQRPKFYWLLLMVLFLISSATGLWEALTPRDPVNFALARDPYALLHDGRYWALLVASLCVAGMTISRSAPMLACLFVICLSCGAAVLLQDDVWSPLYGYTLRLYMTVTIFFACIVLWVLRWRVFSMNRAKSAAYTGIMSLSVFALFFITSICDMRLSLQYRDYLDHFRSEVNTRNGEIPFEFSNLSYDSLERKFYINWTHPLMSLLLRTASDKAIILNEPRYHGYQGFCDPPKHVPDFGRYYDTK